MKFFTSPNAIEQLKRCTSRATTSNITKHGKNPNPKSRLIISYLWLLLYFGCGPVTRAIAQAPTVNEPPAQPYSILIFPERDFVSTAGYADGTETVTLELIRNGTVVNTVGPVNPIVDPKTGTLAEINHPGGFCWTGSVPYLRPGDQVRQTVTNATGTVVNQTTTQDVTAERPLNPSAGVIEVHGTAIAADGSRILVDQLEQRLISKNNPFAVNGKRTLRASAGSEGTLIYDPIDPDKNPGGIRWTATYKNLSAGDVSLAMASESRILWRGINPASTAEATIFENDPGAIFHGPAVPPCTPGVPQEPLDTAAPTVPSGVTADANGRTVTLSWTASTDNVALRYYKIYRDTNATSGKPQLIKIIGPGLTTFIDNNVTSGDHSYSVEALDAVRNSSGLSAAVTASVGAGAPTIDSKPASPSKVNQGLSFTFSSTTPGATFLCSFSTGADSFSACTSPVSYGTAAAPVADGTYTFKVVAQDTGNPPVLSPPTLYKLVVDTVAPVVTLDSKPPDPTNNTTPTFTFSSTEANVNFQCSLGSLLNPPAMTACTSPLKPATPLAEGSSTFRVQAIDAAGNAGQAVTYNFNVATTAPTVTLTAKPAALINDAKPGFGFTSAAANPTYECSLVTAGSPLPGFNPCTSPFAPAAALVDGSYTFTVRVTDGAGNNGTSSPFDFTVDTKAPTVAANPAGGTFNKVQNVTLTASDTSATTIFYSLDGSVPTSASTRYTTPVAISTTPAAGTTLKYVAVDGAGNSSATGSQTYIIDATAPAVAASPVGGIFGSAQSVTLTADKAGSSIFYTLNGTQPTTASTQYTGPIALPLDKATTVTYIAVDSVGNQSTAASQSYTIDTLAPSVPAASPAGGTFASTQTVTLNATDSLTGVKSIFYTNDGSDPKTSATKQTYTGAITIPVSPTPKTTTLTFYALDAAGNVSANGTQAYVIDGVAPAVTITPFANNLTNKASGTIPFTVSKASTNTCTFGPTGGAPIVSAAACTTSFAYGPLTTNGSYTLTVDAKDSAGNTGSTSYAFTLDTAAPTVTALPAGGTFASAQSVTLSLGAGEAASTQIRYTLGPAGSAAPTASTGTVYSGPISVSSSATVQYIAVDVAGNSSAVGSQNYIINLAPAAVTLGAAPASPTNSATLSYSFALTASSPAGSTTECMLSPAETTFTACTSPKVYGSSASPLAPGTYTFQVRGVSGSTPGTPVSAAAVTIDRTAPSVTASPVGGTFTSTQSVALNLGAGEPASTQIRYTLGPSGTAAPTATTGNVYGGPISVSANATLQYIAVDAAGNVSPVGSQSYVINIPPPPAPTVSITGAPASPTGSATLSYSFALGASSPSGSTTQCMLSPVETAFTPCGSPKVYGSAASPLPGGTYNFQVRAINGSTLGNTATAAPVTIDHTAPTVSASPAGGTFTSAQNVTLTLGAGEPASSAIRYTLGPAGTAAPTATTGTAYSGPIAVSSTATLQYIAVDAAGNASGVGSQSYTINTAANGPTSTAPASKFVAGQIGATGNTVPVNLTWSATAAAGVTISKYELQRSTDNGATFAAVTLASATATNLTQSLAPGNYIFRVRATDNAGGVGNWAQAASLNVGLTDSTATTAIAYTASFVSTTQTGAVGGTVRSSSTANATAKFTVTSTPGVRSISLVASKTPTSGKAFVFVDGSSTAAATIDLYSATTQMRQVVFTIAVSPSTGTHSLLVKVAGTKNAASTGTRVDMDAFTTLR
ncbi:MAG TPA: chitobiase/beta-hexosaminidase C-terminal domain-containing protein [Candidatus Angelobacter sp.]|nr:chitobiase/beta-hexosaminidase C-terminal domain-containing protein [Candidatus Angelobacter sp.]